MTHIPEKAYKNLTFLNSPSARPIRILCEYEETRQRFLAHGIENTIVFFGSARAKPVDETQPKQAAARAAAAANPDDEGLAAAAKRADQAVGLSQYYEAARELSRRLTEWDSTRDGRDYYISTGGGPGIMEAGNRGAAEAGGRSVGLGISLPFEAGVNEWVTRGLDFEFHYFFTRKYWFLYLCKAMVIFPGGFGTMDEFFETLTLIQTGKIKKKVPLVVFGKSYWERVLNVDVMAEVGTISPGDVNLYKMTDSIDEAFDYIVQGLTHDESDQ
jgi:uncharacterized protein (TIGR00730 family)